MTSDFLEFIDVLSDAHVDFILVGGYAYIFNVESRYTGDIDFWVEPSRENLERLSVASQRFLGIPLNVNEILRILATDKLGFGLVGRPPNKIEILLKVSGLDYQEARLHARLSRADDSQFLVLHPHDQIRNKRASNREKDQLDIKNLVELYGEPPE